MGANAFCILPLESQSPSRAADPVPSTSLTDGKTEAQRGWATCPVLHSWSIAKPLQPPLGTILSSGLKVRIKLGGKG